ncbi:hypothetical protein ACFVMC_00900 [Nocardia sp. NPDC127579]|uniref:hypothetical protein n=1 Tax=Nocardia sp. NPDC127579 TaxID=3345402 RepID=UPI0036362CB4
MRIAVLGSRGSQQIRVDLVDPGKIVAAEYCDELVELPWGRIRDRMTDDEIAADVVSRDGGSDVARWGGTRGGTGCQGRAL